MFVEEADVHRLKKVVTTVLALGAVTLSVYLRCGFISELKLT